MPQSDYVNRIAIEGWPTNSYTVDSTRIVWLYNTESERPGPANIAAAALHTQKEKERKKIHRDLI